MEERIFPLHPAQRDVYIDQLINKESPHCNIGGCWKLIGALDKSIFKDIVRCLPESFDAFRMKFRSNEHGPVCYFDEQYDVFEIQEMDFSNLDNPRQSAEKWAQSQFNIPFKIENDRLLFSHVLLKISENEHWYFIKSHHLITDGQGISVWMQFIASKYKSALTNTGPGLVVGSYESELIRLSGADTAINQEIAGKYWEDKVKGITPEVFRERYTELKDRSGKYEIDLSIEQRKMLNSILACYSTTLQQITIAALIIYFSRTLEQSEFIFGLMLHKRTSRRQRDIVGMFSAYIPFVGRYEADITVSTFIKKIARSQRQDYRFSDFDLESVSKYFNRSSSGRMFDVTVNHRLFDFELDFGEAIRVETAVLTSEFELWPLRVHWDEFSETQPLKLGIHFQFRYVSREEAELFAQRIFFILEQFRNGYDKPLKSIQVLPPMEYRRLMEASGGLETNYLRGMTIMDLFEEQVLRTPDAEAVVFGEERLTYRELNERSNQLGHYLRRRGVRAESLVPVCLERSTELIIGVLGILKAGGAYVPIDPSYPAERIGYMLADTGAKMVLSGGSCRERLPAAEPGEWEIIGLDDWSQIGAEPVDRVEAERRVDQLAYVIYTSGSTGRPKGVMIEQRGLVNLVSWHLREYEVTAASRSTVLAGVGFDAFGWEVWPYLSAGACICLVKDGGRIPAGELSELYAAWEITHSFIPTAMVADCIGVLGKVTSLQYVLTGGERLGGIDVTGLGYTLVNNYGPTENTVVATSYRVVEQDRGKTPPIGRPISNTRVYILGEDGQLCPVGVAGELCIGGQQVARGYWNQPELTAERFIEDPFGADPGSRLYRTGDVCRWLG
ncbi:amino acid adenylation domain-containing protein, partial [Flavitalea sp. BT771]|uniref:non-ribosomal peptide synthetase n=1 Tax=Flavitalea sp. BT771 TaxID=3063329 RepID=UPI0026E1C65B